ncbi:MAG: integral rane sensor signal transduction histidine kinase [Deltaproteobacteria bacterium]|jgi:two-component system, NtrC family, sensor histidine kinase GlrK|nr:integral rane sensor signal transduction histidine kinase [Deltaproteobacteria bacterium]
MNRSGMKFTIFSRLMLGYFTVFVVVMAVSVYTILKIRQLNKGTDDILNIDNRILEGQKKLAEAILSQVRYERKYFITRDNTFYKQFLSAKGEFDKYLEDVLSVADTPSKKECLDKIKSHYEDYQSLINQEMKHLKANRRYRKRAYDAGKEKATDGILEQLELLENHSRQDIRNRIRFLEEAGAAAERFAVVMSGIAILLVVATSFLITRGITRPLTVLMGKTKEISSGVFKGNLNISSPPEISELSIAFNSMCDKLRVVDRMKSDFFSTMSHELRTPLTSIKEGTSLLLEEVAGTITDKQRRLLNILAEESNRLIGLVSSLLDLSKMESGMTAYSFEPTRLVSLINKVTKEMGPIAESRKIGMETEVDEGLPLLRLDGERILQVLRNIIGNATKFTPKGGKVKISAHPVDQGVKVSVADTGPGIPEKDLNTIFEKFQQAPLPGSYPTTGTGLGLAIAKHIITSHGGKIWVESEPGKGSTFIFVLPA